MTKKIVLDAVHRNLGARMVPFAGYDMPVSYKGIIEEHKAVRNDVGLFDVSHMGILKVSGKDAAQLLDKVFTKAASHIEIGKGAYALLCNEEGGTLDDLIFYRRSQNEYIVALNASNKESDLEWIKGHGKNLNVELVSCFDSHALFALQGPRSFELMKTLGVDLNLNQLYASTQQEFFGKDILFLTSGYTGEKGCEISCPIEVAEKFFNLLLEKGAAVGLQPCGLGARDTLRTEMGYSLYGHELNLSINPIEASLSWAIDFDKHDFIGKEALLRAKANPTRKLIALKNPASRQAPRSEMKIFDANQAEVGFITSGTFSPSLGFAIGLGIVSKNSQAPYSIDIRGQKVVYETCKRPFLQK